jgi:osmotically-inducible protein OsmY
MSLLSLTAVLCGAGACATATDQYERRARAAEAIHAAAEAEEEPAGARALRAPFDPVNDEDAAWLALAVDDDLRIAAAVRERILGAADVSSQGKNVTIVSDGGAVVLKGRVSSDDEGRRVIALARDVSGVRTVEDRLVVDPRHPVTP